MEFIKRFAGGVHSRGDCGKNHGGFAATQAAIQYNDLHCLDYYPFASCVPSSKHIAKRSVAIHDTIMYMMIKCIEISPPNCTYVLLLTRNTTLPRPIYTLLEKLSHRGNTVVLVHIHNSVYLISLYHSGVKLSVLDIPVGEAADIFLVISGYKNVTLVMYPETTKHWINVANDISPSIWCTTASMHHLSASEKGSAWCSSFAFPWSRQSAPSGYTLGSGAIKEASCKDLLEFEGKMNFYDRMVSSVPLGDSCTDCRSMQEVSELLQKMLEIEEPKRKRPLSTESIQALEQLNRMIESYKL